MCFTVPARKREGNYCVLTSDGEVRQFAEVSAACRVLFSINGKKESACYMNVGLGPDTNTLCLGDNEYCRMEYGNITNERILECFRTLLDKGWIDLSEVKIIHDLSEISEINDAEYLYFMEPTAFCSETEYKTVISTSVKNWTEQEETFFTEEDDDTWGEDFIPLLD